jgi:dolichol-phosphate mannosyltransferase
MNKNLIIIPTYDERENVRPIAEAIFAAAPATDVLFVDDNSPDGTGQILDEMARGESRVNVLHKPGKQGLGRAYISGFKWALERHYEYVFEMDADFSHDPKEIPNFLKAAQNADLVIGSRYVNGVRVMNWPVRRLILSKGAALYVRLVTGLPVSDPTGGYKCYRREVLTTIPLDAIASNGYSFQVEMTYNAWFRGFRIVEIPIVFEDRHSGYSKMSSDIMKEALQIVIKLAFRHGFRRSPGLRPAPAAPPEKKNT